MKEEGTNNAFNMLGGSLEGFSIPVGLFKGVESSYQQKGGSLCNMTTPDVTDVTAVPKGLYERLLDLAKYSDGSAPKKQTKGRNRKRVNKKTRKL